jgi:hypothetical protein
LESDNEALAKSLHSKQEERTIQQPEFVTCVHNLNSRMDNAGLFSRRQKKSLIKLKHRQKNEKLHRLKKYIFFSLGLNSRHLYPKMPTVLGLGLGWVELAQLKPNPKSIEIKYPSQTPNRGYFWVQMNA